MTDDLIRKTFANCLILQKIGQGGMGVVYKAHHLSLNKVVCIKILAKELEADPRNIDFFLREAEISKQLDHPNTIHIYDYGREKDNYYIVMSYVEGKSLEELVKEKGYLSVKEASDIMIGVFEGLSHAHLRNIIHRDIKPSNIILTKDNIPRIIDFGLARRIVEEKQLTVAGEMIGTAYFMSPEQGLGKKVDHRADLYSAGATYFYILTGRYPFDGRTAIEVINKHINEPLPNLYMIKPDLPIWLVRMIEKLMKKNPEERYKNAKEVSEELKKYREKNYENIIESKEVEFDLEKLKTTQNSVSQTLRIKPQPQENIIGEIKVKEERSGGAKEKKEEINENILPQDKKRLQSPFMFYSTKITYHFFFSALFISSFLLFSGYLNYLQPITSIKNYPYSLIFFISGLSSLVLNIKISEIKSPVKYFSFVFLFLITLISNYKNLYININGVLDKIIYIVNSININKNNLFIASFTIAFISHIISSSFKGKISKLVSSILFVLSIYFLICSINSFISIDIKQLINILLIASIIIGIINIFIRKSILMPFFILFFIAYPYIVKPHYIEINLEKRYQMEMEKYKKQKEETILKIKEKYHSKLKEKLSYATTDKIEEIKAEIEDELKKEIQKETALLKEPVKEEISKNINEEYFRSILKNLYYNYFSNYILVSVFIFFILNFIFITDLFLKKEDYYEI